MCFVDDVMADVYSRPSVLRQKVKGWDPKGAPYLKLNKMLQDGPPSELVVGATAAFASLAGGWTVEELELAPAPKREAEYVAGSFGKRKLVSGAKLTADEAVGRGWDGSGGLQRAQMFR